MRWKVACLALAAGVAGAAPAVYSAHFRNFHAVRPGVLYRSGQLSPTGLDVVLRAYGIRTVVTLRTVRDPGQPYLDAWEEGVCARRGARHVRILPREWLPDQSGEPPARAAVEEFLAVMDDPANHPVLVHCFAGVHRAGTMAAVFRMEYCGWSADAAIAELERYGFDPGQRRDAIDDFLRKYKRR